MCRHLAPAILAITLLAGCGLEDEQSLGQVQAPLTTTDVDTPPECQGILNFVNLASFETLDLYLPSNCATTIVNRRAVSSIVSIADLSSIKYVGEVALNQIYGGAVAEGYVGASCLGIFDELAVSADDAAALVNLVNTISAEEMHDILPLAWNGAVNLLTVRPFTTVAAISGTSGIGPVSLRNLRNAATLSGPLETLIAAVNAQGGGWSTKSMARHFDWYQTLHTYHLYQWGATCFGINESALPQGTQVRSYLADDAEVHARVLSTVNYAGSGNIDPAVIAAGMSNLDTLAAGRTFKGCYIDYSDDPWSAYHQAFFVDTENGFGVMTETGWSE